jgi:hypothetical protein
MSSTSNISRLPRVSSNGVRAESSIGPAAIASRAELSKSARFVDGSLSHWLGSTPPELVHAHLNLDPATIAALTSDQKTTVA